MTSNKRVEIVPCDGELEPKRPRGGEEVEQTNTESEGLEPVPSLSGAERVGSASASSQVKDDKDHHREYLRYSGGRREPRIGDDFQVSILPSPGDPSYKQVGDLSELDVDEGEKK